MHYACIGKGEGYQFFYGVSIAGEDDGVFVGYNDIVGTEVAHHSHTFYYTFGHNFGWEHLFDVHVEEFAARTQ
jgi:hypothetical protein